MHTFAISIMDQSLAQLALAQLIAHDGRAECVHLLQIY